MLIIVFLAKIYVCLILCLKTSNQPNLENLIKLDAIPPFYGVHPCSALDLFLENVMLHVYMSAKSIVMQLSTV